MGAGIAFWPSAWQPPPPQRLSSPPTKIRACGSRSTHSASAAEMPDSTVVTAIPAASAALVPFDFPISPALERNGTDIGTPSNPVYAHLTLRLVSLSLAYVVLCLNGQI